MATRGFTSNTSARRCITGCKKERRRNALTPYSGDD
jgi:hypothetical protein